MPVVCIVMALVLVYTSGCAGATKADHSQLAEANARAGEAGLNRSGAMAAPPGGLTAGGLAEEAFDEIRAELAALVELERRGRYEAGLGLYESGLRERLGDRAGAVFAAYKDLAYAYGRGTIKDTEIDERLGLLEDSARGDERPDPSVLSAISAIRLYRKAQWPEAHRALDLLVGADEAADSFARWMSLSARLESGQASASELERYSLMQARYSRMPEYWLRCMRAWEQPELRRDAAERSVLLAPSGPFALSARSALAESYGLRSDAGSTLLVRAEMDGLAALVEQSGDYRALSRLLPLLALPDNPLTMYAIGLLKQLGGSGGCREWLAQTARAHGGRVAERLSYAAGR